MKHSFINLLNQPDSFLFQYEDSCVRFEEPDSYEEKVSKIDYKVENNAGIITLYPSERPIKRVKLRWRGDLSDGLMVLGDAYARGIQDINWMGITPNHIMPWYFHLYDGEKLNCFGVKTGAAGMCSFQCDPFGITLWVDVRNGGCGVRNKDPFVIAEVVCREGTIGETPFDSAHQFCKQMCDNPVLPKEPIFGVNNWYWAYGNISHESVMTETDYLMEMCRDAKAKPYMIIDDGWQINRYSAKRQGYYNGGPWDRTNANFKSMAETSDAIHQKGAKSGIWFRPLQTFMQVKEPLEAPRRNPHSPTGINLDPSHPDVLEMVAKDTAMIRGWGYDLIKHDFTSIDTLGNSPYNEDGDWYFYDRTLTNMQIIKRLYQTIQNAAGDAVVIGCNTINHLVAGIHASQRSGNDTSGRNFEITRLACNCMMRFPQNNAFFNVDPDCAAFTEKVDAGLNLDFLENCAITGAVTLASVTPGILKDSEMNRIMGIYEIASKGGLGAKPTDWLGHNVMSRYETPDGKKFNFDWYRGYDGVRTFYTWNN